MRPQHLLAQNGVKSIKAKCLSYYHHLLLSYADLSVHWVLEVLYFRLGIRSEPHYLKTNIQHLSPSNYLSIYPTPDFVFFFLILIVQVEEI